MARKGLANKLDEIRKLDPEIAERAEGALEIADGLDEGESADVKTLRKTLETPGLPEAVRNGIAAEIKKRSAPKLSTDEAIKAIEALGLNPRAILAAGLRVKASRDVGHVEQKANK